jgi:RNA polymerase sigma-70 factor (ECF subfamily)
MTEDDFTAAYESCFPRVYGFCRFRSECAADAEDLAAEAFARLLVQPSMPSDKTLPWLLRVARNLSIDRSRRTARISLGYEADGVADPVAAPTWRDDSVWLAVRELTADQRLVIYLRGVEDLSFGEIAKLSGRSETAARMVYHRGVKRLARLLEVTEDD